jgi:hypothetical protein
MPVWKNEFQSGKKSKSNKSCDSTFSSEALLLQSFNQLKDMLEIEE